MYLPPEDRIRLRRDGCRVLLPSPSVAGYTPELVDTLALDREASILITGDTGSGKEELASVLAAGAEKFITINCLGVEGPIIESELFGHVRGAFTGADNDRAGILLNAINGTVFLDEIGRLSKSSQARILRYLQTGEIRPVGADKPVATRGRARVLAATNVDVGGEDFLPDLRERFDFHIKLPALASRGADILYLLTLEEFSQVDTSINSMSLGAVCSAMLYDWPGNIRELMRFARSAHRLQQHSPLMYRSKTPWPQNVLHAQPQYGITTHFALDKKINRFCQFATFALRKLLDTVPPAVFEREESIQRTVALLQSIPWMITDQPPDRFRFFNSPQAYHPLVIPFRAMYPRSSRRYGYDLSWLFNAFHGYEDPDTFEIAAIGPVHDAPLPYFLEEFVRMFDQYGEIPDAVRPIDAVNTRPPEGLKDILSRLPYPRAVRRIRMMETDFEQAIRSSNLEPEEAGFCQKVQVDRAAGIPREQTARSLNMGASTLRARINGLARLHPALAPFIQNTPGRPAKTAKR